MVILPKSLCFILRALRHQALQNKIMVPPQHNLVRDCGVYLDHRQIEKLVVERTCHNEVRVVVLIAICVNNFLAQQYFISH